MAVDGFAIGTYHVASICVMTIIMCDLTLHKISRPSTSYEMFTT